MLHCQQACGFELVFEDSDGGGPSEGFAVLPQHSELVLLQAALQLLGQPPAPAIISSSGERLCFYTSRQEKALWRMSEMLNLENRSVLPSMYIQHC
jgi:hypothetical protein